MVSNLCWSRRVPASFIVVARMLTKLDMVGVLKARD